MTAETIALIGAVVGIIAIAAIGWAIVRSRKSKRLQQHFGPEYGQTVAELGDRRSGESELEARQKRVEQLQIKPLRSDEAAAFGERWRSVQAIFVDDPAVAIHQADHLVNEVMLSRGYPMGNFEQRAADVSVDHANVVNDYRAAHAIAVQTEQGRAQTEDLRQAMIHYRALFQDLLETESTTDRSGDASRQSGVEQRGRES